MKTRDGFTLLISLLVMAVAVLTALTLAAFLHVTGRETRSAAQHAQLRAAALVGAQTALGELPPRAVAMWVSLT